MKMEFVPDISEARRGEIDKMFQQSKNPLTTSRPQSSPTVEYPPCSGSRLHQVKIALDHTHSYTWRTCLDHREHRAQGVPTYLQRMKKFRTRVKNASPLYRSL